MARQHPQGKPGGGVLYASSGAGRYLGLCVGRFISHSNDEFLIVLVVVGFHLSFASLLIIFSFPAY